MDTNVIKYGDEVVVDGFRGENHVEVKGTIVGISEYCYTIKDDNGKEWDADLALVKLV